MATTIPVLVLLFFFLFGFVPGLVFGYEAGRIRTARKNGQHR